MTNSPYQRKNILEKLGGKGEQQVFKAEQTLVHENKFSWKSVHAPPCSVWVAMFLVAWRGGWWVSRQKSHKSASRRSANFSWLPKKIKAIYSKHSTQNTLLNTTKSQHVGLMQASNNPLSSTWVIFLRAPASSRRIKQARESKKQENNSHHDNHARSSRTLATQLVFCVHCTTQHTGLCRYITYATGS